MILSTNSLTDSITTLTNTGHLSTEQRFNLASDQKTLNIVNCSDSKTQAGIIKGTRPTIKLTQFGDENISDGIPFSLEPLEVQSFALQLMYKHFGELGDQITITSTSIENSKLVCWLSE